MCSGERLRPLSVTFQLVNDIVWVTNWGERQKRDRVQIWVFLPALFIVSVQPSVSDKVEVRVRFDLISEEHSEVINGTTSVFD